MGDDACDRSTSATFSPDRKVVGSNALTFDTSFLVLDIARSFVCSSLSNLHGKSECASTLITTVHARDRALPLPSLFITLGGYPTRQ